MSAGPFSLDQLAEVHTWAFTQHEITTSRTDETIEQAERRISLAGDEIRPAPDATVDQQLDIEAFRAKCVETACRWARLWIDGQARQLLAMPGEAS